MTWRYNEGHHLPLKQKTAVSSLLGLFSCCVSNTNATHHWIKLGTLKDEHHKCINTYNAICQNGLTQNIANNNGDTSISNGTRPLPLDYSCAYIGDILLQGHLYITKNHFAFYSNVFGYVTKLLIPMASVEKITKEKTARIIPNAVGIATADEKHVFGTLLSRDNTYKYMIKIWNLSQQALEDMIEAESLAEVDNVENIVSESDSSETKDIDSEKESFSSSQISGTRLSNMNILLDGASQKRKSSNVKFKIIQGYRSFLSMPSHTLVLFAAMFLLIMLFLSATLLIYRISKINDKYISLVEDQDLSANGDIYSHLLRSLIHLHSKSAGSLHNYVDSNLQQISKVLHDLEILSSLLMPKDSSNNAKETLKDDLEGINS